VIPDDGQVIVDERKNESNDLTGVVDTGGLTETVAGQSPELDDGVFRSARLREER
jgi:hypothetical protein